MLRNQLPLDLPSRLLRMRRGLRGHRQRLVRQLLVRQRIRHIQFTRHRSSRRSSARRLQQHPRLRLRNRDSLRSGPAFRRKGREFRRNVRVGPRVQRAARRLRANGHHFDRASLCKIGLARRKACVPRQPPGNRARVASRTLAVRHRDFRSVQGKADRGKVLADLVRVDRAREAQAA